MMKRMHKLFVSWGALCAILIIFTTMFSMKVSAADDYPSKYKNAGLDAIVDEWNFYNRECTSFVAWCLNSRNGVGFHNHYGGVRWGHAKNWGNAARSIGITVDSNPSVGSVAWWTTGTYGHVAWVSDVNGGNVTVEDYNGDYKGNYRVRTIPASWPAGYIHIKDMAVQPSATFAPWDYEPTTFIGNTDACIGQQTTYTGRACTDVGMYLFDANGNYLASASNGRYYRRYYFKINEEMRVTLTPGTLYKYKFFAIVDGQTFWGPEGSFTTTGSKPGWRKDGNNWVFVKMDGSGLETGWQRIDNQWYYFNEKGIMQIGWKKIEDKWYLFNAGGSRVQGWKLISGKWYYFNPDGVMQTGWIKVSGKWYYCNSNGVMQTGWIRIADKWYYLSDGGVMRTGWIRVSGKWYYCNSNGVLQTGWIRLSDKWYYCNSYGVMQVGWLKVSGKWYYLSSNGSMRTGWQGIQGKMYFFKTSGVMAVLEWYDGFWLGEDGSCTYPYTAEWKRDKKGWWYEDSGGYYPKNTTVKIDGQIYSFDGQGYWKK